MKRIITSILIFLSLWAGAQNSNLQTVNERDIWLDYLDKLARPVIYNLAMDKLKEKMPVVLSDKTDNPVSRRKVAYLEAFGRTMSGIAPWLNLEDGDKAEIALRNQYRDWALKAIANATNPKAKDYLQWEGGQPLVDASFLALAFIRCPWLWTHLNNEVKQQVVDVFKKTRHTVPVYSNWILFSGMIEAFFYKYDLDYDPVRVEFAVREFANHWYVGDGMFSDGMKFHFDYYNSIVIHPFLAAILEVVESRKKTYNWFTQPLDTINKRYAVILERLINTDGSYPVFGRSIAYRCGVFHHLADMALRKKLPQSLPPAQVRCELEAVLKKTLEAPATFNSEGWLNIGLYGKQKDLAESYITTGSLYLCSDILEPLGLSPTDEFWTEPAVPWTSVKIWSGQDVPADHALDLK